MNKIYSKSTEYRQIIFCIYIFLQKKKYSHLTQTRITDLAVKVIGEIVISNISFTFRFYFLLLLFRE